MESSILVALITGVVAALGSVLTAISASKLTAYKIEELKTDFADLKDRVNKHNNLVERMSIVEQSCKSAHKRIDEIAPRRNGRED